MENGSSSYRSPGNSKSARRAARHGFQLRERDPGGARRVLQLAIQSREFDTLAEGKLQIGRIVDGQSIFLGAGKNLAEYGFSIGGIDANRKREQISEESSGFVFANSPAARGHKKRVCHFCRPMLRNNCGIA